MCKCLIYHSVWNIKYVYLLNKYLCNYCILIYYISTYWPCDWSIIMNHARYLLCGVLFLTLINLNLMIKIWKYKVYTSLYIFEQCKPKLILYIWPKTFCGVKNSYHYLIQLVFKFSLRNKSYFLNIKVIPSFCTAHLLLRITRWPP